MLSTARHTFSSAQLAATITKAASKQTYYTIRLLVDRERVNDAFRAYAYFRWLDDLLDEGPGLKGQPDNFGREQRIAFANRQQSLLLACYGSEIPDNICAEEQMLVDLVRQDVEKNSGLQIYLRNMMDVMLFDARRRGMVISQADLVDYSSRLAKAVTEALYYFIGHEDPSPCHEARYMAVYAAHITHMLRDGVEDAENGFYNISAEYLTTQEISPRDVHAKAYREWVRSRVRLARENFMKGRECTAKVKNWRCRLAGCAYTARFEWILGAIERDDYVLRTDYSARKSFGAGLWMAWQAICAMFGVDWTNILPGKLSVQTGRRAAR